MTIHIKQRFAKAQSGAVMLVLFMVLFVFASTIFLSAANSGARELNENNEVRYQMNQAKAALISYAFNYETFNKDGDGDGDFDEEGPGRLPCPDVDNDGISDSTCSSNLERGRLPEYLVLPSGSRIPLNSVYKGIDQQFWYVVSNDFRENRNTKLNSNDNADFTIDGIGDYVAVIIAPGEALSTQDRTDKTDPANYLESVNVTNGGSDRDFVNSNPADPDNFNDMVLGITWSDIMTAMTLKVVQEIKIVLDLHHDSTCLWAVAWCDGSFPQYPNNDTTANFWEFSPMMERAQGWVNPWPVSWPITYPDDFDWYQDNSIDEDGDNWNLVTTYTRLGNNTARISFANCAINYTVTHDGGITRDRPSC